MHSFFSLYLIAAILLTVPVCIVGLINLFAFRKPKAVVAAEENLPFISVLIPARDEEKVIARCVESLLGQNYPKFEVIVLDDNSSDTTYEILCKLRDRDHRLRVLAGALLPEGWCGKPHACWQLANAASGTCILFTDADCIFTPDALLFAVGAMSEHAANIVSLSPDYVAKSFWEHLLVSQLIYIPLYFAPMPLVNGRSFPIIAGANGSFLYMNLATYFDIDGHRAVKSELAEDVKFAQMAKRNGKKIWYGDGISVYSVRMYENLSEIWRGFTRNLFPAFSGRLIYIIPSLMFLAVVFVIPFFLAIDGILTRANWTWFAFTPYILVVMLRISIWIALKRGTSWLAPLDPLAWLATIVIAVGSIVKTLCVGSEWKGRTYVKGQIRTKAE